jgi:hypothetical protein
MNKPDINLPTASSNRRVHSQFFNETNHRNDVVNAYMPERSYKMLHGSAKPFYWQ